MITISWLVTTSTYTDVFEIHCDTLGAAFKVSIAFQEVVRGVNDILIMELGERRKVIQHFTASRRFNHKHIDFFLNPLGKLVPMHNQFFPSH